MILRFIVSAVVAAALLQPAGGAVVLNEALVSTTGADSEFIELYNTGPSAVDISGWFIDEIESDAASTPGTIDDTFVIPASVTLAPGAFYLLGNAQFATVFGVTPDVELPISVENSSVTLSLKDSQGVEQYSAFLSDDDGVAQGTPDISIGPDGTFSPAGYFLDTDGGNTASLLEFSPQPAASATPGFSNVTAVPEPSSIACLAVLGAGGVFRRVRRKKVA